MKGLYQCPEESRSCVRPSIFYLNFTASLWELTNPSATIKEWILPCYPVFGLSRRFCQDMTSIVAHFWPKLITWHPWDIWEITIPSLDHHLVYLSESHSVVSDFLRPYGLYSPWNFPGQSTGVGSLSLLQRTSPSQRLNAGIPHCGRILYQLSPQGSPCVPDWCIKRLVRSLKHEVQSLPAHCWPRARPGQWFCVSTRSSWYVRETSPLRSFRREAGRRS